MSSTLVMVGTQKGAFFFESDLARRNWKMTGPHLAGWEISALHLTQSNGSRRIFAGTTHYSFGATFRCSDDMGSTWKEMSGRPMYPEASGRKVKRIWQIVDGHSSQPGTLYCGIDEAGLFVSRNAGESWEEVTGLTRPRNTAEWFPGNGGLCLHTILVDPTNAGRMWVGISAVGFFRTEDGGETWVEAVAGLPSMPTGVEGTPECRCVHKVVVDPSNPNTLFMQFHGGVFRSTDAGANWKAIENGLPGNFGFPAAITRRGEVFIVPLTSDEKRFVPEGKLAVYRWNNAANTWNAMSKGLPTEPQFVNVLRDAMATDPHDPGGVYFGTTMGELFYSIDAGDSWAKLPGSFPRIESVRAYAI